MSTSPDTFDPLAVVVEWLDTGRSGNLYALLDLYDEKATLHCLCENGTLVGRKSFAAYWAPKLKNKLGSAFTLDEVVLFGNIVQVDYRNYDDRPLRIYFHFDNSGKIVHTSCRALAVVLLTRLSAA
jgi:hypothetical protein